MFTGIVECLGSVEQVIESGSNVDLVVRSPISSALKIDQSIAHDGVCLTVVAQQNDMHTVTVIKESLERSGLGKLEKGSSVNLERCLKIGDRLDGHMVQGHVDETVRCLEIVDHGGSWHFRFLLPAEPELIVRKGSITLNGVSLTVAALTSDSFSVAIIPYTYENTTFSKLEVNDRVNVEYDILGKYVQRQLATQNT